MKDLKLYSIMRKSRIRGKPKSPTSKKQKYKKFSREKVSAFCYFPAFKSK